MSAQARLIALIAFSIAPGCAARPADDAEDGASASDSSAISCELTPMKAGQHHQVAFDGTSRWRGFSFHGAATSSVSLFASTAAYKANVDTVLCLYRVSRTTGRVFGRSLACNDDTSREGWTTAATDSSIDHFVLPEARDYAILVRTYRRSERGQADVWFLNDLGPATPTHFPAEGAAAAIPSFSEAGARELPISAEAIALQDRASSNGWMLGFARVQLEKGALAAVVADPSRFGALGYDVMYYAGAKPFGSAYKDGHGPAQLTRISAAVAVSTLQGASSAAPLSADALVMRDLERRMVESIFGDGDFAAGAASVDVYRVHWDNADDTNAEGILAIDATRGELRAVTYVNPP